MTVSPRDPNLVAGASKELETARGEAREQEALLWEAFRGGSEAAFSRIYREHAKVLLTYGKKISKNSRLVEDCLHDLFIELWNRKQHLSAISSTRLYLLKAFKHQILRAVAGQNRLALGGEPQEADLNFAFSYEHELITAQLTAEQDERLKACVAGLSENQREIIYLRFYSNLSYEQIGEMMNINYQSVKNLMFRAMRSLRHQLTTILLYICVTLLR